MPELLRHQMRYGMIYLSYLGNVLGIFLITIHVMAAISGARAVRRREHGKPHIITSGGSHC